MTTRRRSRIALDARRGLLVVGLVMVGLLIGVVAAGGGVGQVLVVTDASGQDLVSVPVDDGTTVVLAYTHSVERTPVRDVYVVDDGALVMDRMEFRSYGAGLPSTAPVTRTPEGDSYEYRPPEQRHEMLSVSTGPVAGHELHVGDQRYDLVERSAAGTVTIRIERRLRSPL